MQVVMTQELIMDSSHNVMLANVPIATGEKFTVIVLRDNHAQNKPVARKVYAHRIAVDDLELPSRVSLHER
ncbi:hypothetical protein KFZ76_05295 [Methylovulum psychrotolerans]|uniref:hypothetical protein n=1 Tax=Methylovulum psychrotolerans TaxID=1704499 RepID=UPI001BFEFCFE|nr:hypothetical protein [Methylovulum psychrotolerans]MBT9097125.1 hypothetical protein [Methylovulum psychrotolerans]